MVNRELRRSFRERAGEHPALVFLTGSIPPLCLAVVPLCGGEGGIVAATIFLAISGICGFLPLIFVARMDRMRWSGIGAAWVVFLVAVGHFVPVIAKSVAGPKGGVPALDYRGPVLAPREQPQAGRSIGPPLLQYPPKEPTVAPFSAGPEKDAIPSPSRGKAAPNRKPSVLEPPEESVKPATPKQSAQPPLLPSKEVRIASWRLLPFMVNGDLYAKEFVIQTTVDIHPTWLALRCNAEIVQAECWINQGMTLCNFSGCGQLLSKDKKTIWIHFREPTFSAQTPLIVTLLARTDITAQSVSEERPPIDSDTLRSNQICIRKRLGAPKE